MVTLPMFDGLLPDDVKTAWGDPREDAPIALPAEEALIERAVEKRKREFRKARACARSLLHEFGVREFPLLSGPQREPLWPEGLIGSVTHTDGLCAVAVASRRLYAGIGIDVEPAEPLSERIANRVCSAEELAIARAQNELDALTLARVLFSAKEAFYKAQFCVTQKFLGFSDVAVELGGNGVFFVRVVADVAELANTQFVGRWASRGGFVLTSSWLGQKLG
ncbi:MAG TPA: 4'-phosphopantetheinyl transferase superfamily protein [Polyangiaceae bacterium]|nr:4'-phosphopantetheinyl transferase superfamily protein [Polyangiaceae bacterium]